MVANSNHWRHGKHFLSRGFAKCSNSDTQHTAYINNVVDININNVYGFYSFPTVF